MPTARELLEQADALMRRNREREREPEPDIPELTDEVDLPESAQLARAGEQVAPAAPANHEHAADAGRDEIPLEPHPDDSEVSRWLETDMGAPSVTGPAPDSVVVVPQPAPRAKDEEPPVGRGEFQPLARPVALGPMPTTASELVATRAAGSPTVPPAEPPEIDEDFEAMLGNAPPARALEPDLPRPLPSPEADAPAHVDETAHAGARAGEPVPFEPAAEATAATPAAVAASTRSTLDRAQLDALAEEIRMQVLQRVDIFTDTGLSGELAERLQPAVERASADLVATINREVGQLLRAYVAEAIEREIEKWRQANP